MGSKEQKRQIHIAICDDELPILEHLCQLTENTLLDYDVSIFSSVSAEEISACNAPFDIAVLDIQLPEHSGLKLAESLIANNPSIKIIFVSGYICYVSDVYDVPHLGMVLKSDLEEYLPKFLLRAIETQNEASAHFLQISNQKGDHHISDQDIRWIERVGHASQIHMKNGNIIRTRQTLNALMQDYTAGTLFRSHIGYVVNLECVKSMQRTQFVLDDNTIVPISRANWSSAKERYFNILF